MSLWHNTGEGIFSKVTSGAIANDVGVAWATLWADYNNDGFMDLLVIDDAGPANFLYLNNRDGSFTRVLTNIIATDSWSAGAEGGAWGDIDNDGFLDLFVTDNAGIRNRLYHNNGDGTFTSISSGPELVPPAGGRSQGCVWGDYDNDGYLDLFVTSNNGKNALFHNNGDGTFTQILSGSPANEGGPGILYLSCSWVDYDNDGFLDLFVTRGSTSLGPNLLYHNNGNTNGWIEIKLVGKVSNRSAIGAKVRVHATIGGKTFWQLREIHSGGGWNSEPLVAHFGLGDATNIDMVRIEWPSGIAQTLTNVVPKQSLTVVEHQETAPTAPQFTAVLRSPDGAVNLSVSGDTGFVYLFEASTNLVNWSWLAARTNVIGSIQLVDSRATSYANRFYRVSIP
jgi:hypothetical protein